MPPKKNKKGAPAGNSKSSDRKNAPKVQLSAENERKVRQLLLNSGRNPISSAKSGENSSHVSITQRAKKLEAVYEKLSCEGFRSDQIEHALSALKDEATFEMALDWLCLNIPGNELPSKFSTGTSRNTHEATAYAGGMGSVNIISSAREDWVPSKPSPVEGGGQIQGLTVRHKGNQSKDHDNLLRSSQADWIRQYMEQQEEDDVETYDDDGNCMDDVEETRLSLTESSPMQKHTTLHSSTKRSILDWAGLTENAMLTHETIPLPESFVGTPLRYNDRGLPVGTFLHKASAEEKLYPDE
ncbi:hypothetical protein AMTR_s00025p00230340 [Amborella trichopoda]|uniref:ATP-dependent RNA helicase DHX29-like UBA domain-containing protein n=1 Tax=Amborella trichopoda TaxID=13333 RepID=W1PXD3_AMBTC|nr:hypothetical protein AMTR_s00025p00230340 [Amborella trichopoda]